MKQPPTSQQTPYNSKRDLIKKIHTKDNPTENETTNPTKKNETQATKSRHRSTSRSKEKEKKSTPAIETRNRFKIEMDSMPTI